MLLLFYEYKKVSTIIVSFNFYPFKSCSLNAVIRVMQSMLAVHMCVKFTTHMSITLLGNMISIEISHLFKSPPLALVRNM
jgi:hypothetical protein